MAATLNLVNAATGKRLGAWIVDKMPPVLLSGAALGIGLPALVNPGPLAAAEVTGRLLLPVLLAGVLGAAYQIWSWGWEATAGKTPGNVLFGLRTTNEAGRPAGWAAIFLRGLIIAVGALVPLVGSIVVVISNLWDAGTRRQGWHDKVAKTLVVDVRAGRDPLKTGGLYGTGTPAPETSAASVPGVPSVPAMPSVSSVQSIPSGTAAAAPVPSAPAVPAGPITGIPSFEDTSFADASFKEQSFAEPAFDQSREESVHPDLDAGSTRLKTTAPLPAAVLIRFDDGQEVTVTGAALIGRNPAGGPDESVDQLIDFADMSRSVSKTHLALSVDSAGVWVTDRNSTNGTAVTAPGAAREQLRPGQSVRAGIGSTVHFGDRSFVVGRG